MPKTIGSTLIDREREREEKLHGKEKKNKNNKVLPSESVFILLVSQRREREESKKTPTPKIGLLVGSSTTLTSRSDLLGATSHLSLCQEFVCNYCVYCLFMDFLVLSTWG